MNKAGWYRLYAAYLLTFAIGAGYGISAHAKDIVIGQSTALSGVLASSGEPMRQGAKLYFDMVNAEGGINGRMIRFISLDDRYKVEDTLRNVSQLIERDQAVVLLGGSGTANNQALLNQKLLANANIAMVGPRTGALTLREPLNPYMFHVRASYTAEVEKAIEHFASIGYKKIGVVYQNDSFGVDALSAAKKALLQRSIQAVFLAAYERNSTEVASAVSTAIAADAQAILLLTTSRPTAEFTKQFREAGGTAQLVALSVNDAISIIKEIGVKAAHGLAITTVFPSPTRTDFGIVKEYQLALKKFGPRDEPLSIVALEGFIVAKVIVEALRKAGPDLSRQAMIKSLETMRDADIGGFHIDFGPRLRAGSQYVDITIINKNGMILR